MSTTEGQGNAEGGIAAITNVALCMQAIEQAMQRDAYLPGMSAFYGPAGFGKSLAATHAAVHHHAYFVQVRSSWNRGALLKNILKEMGIKPAKLLADMCDQAAEQLMLSQRPLIIDEFDHLVKNSTIEIVRDLYEASGGAAMLLVGEEHLERNIRPWERFHSRILKWQPAMPTSIEDAQLLAQLYSPDVEIASDLLQQVLVVSRNVTRRVCINISQIRQYALSEGLNAVNRDTWGSRLLDSGDAPRRV